MKILKPAANEQFLITSAPVWPSIHFETDGTGPHTWQWTIAWDSFSRSGVATTPGNQWDTGTTLANYGGTLTVHAQAGNGSAVVSVKIEGTNPGPSEVTSYLATKANSAGFDKIIGQESHYKQFKHNHEPIKSFDNGYGMCQLTSPKPTVEQVWNWKLNVDGGLKLFEAKRTDAIKHLGKSNRSYTNEQLKYETVSRWNGSSYHVWDSQAGKWVRNPHVLCDATTGNIGWDMTQAENKGKTQAELHTRDQGGYAAGKPVAGAHWKYFGICYADHLLGAPPAPPSPKKAPGATPGPAPPPKPTPTPTPIPYPNVT